MSFFRSSATPWFFFLFALIYTAQVFPRLGEDSLTNDEPVEITNGYYYWTQGDIVLPHLHPPLASALSALPLLFMPIRTAAYQGDVLDRAHAFLFEWNKDQIETITNHCRWANACFGLLIGFLLFWITRKEPIWCAATLFFWALNPTFLALAGLAKIELIPDFFLLLAVWLFVKGFERTKPWFFVVAGLVTALAVTAKYDTLILIPIFIFLQGTLDRNFQNRVFQRWVGGFFGFITGVVLVYLPFLLFSPQRSGFFAILWEKLSENFVFAQRGYPVFFLGQAGLESHWYYFPAAFVLKEPLCFVLFLALVLGGMLLKKIQIPLWQWLPVLLLGLCLLPVTNLGVRYLLPLYPFLFLIAGKGAQWLAHQAKGHSLIQGALGGLFLWQLISVLSNYPHELSYFNELVLPNKKIHYLADSNLDWGQDSKRLVEVARQRNWGKVKLADWGGVDPAVYGLDWEPFQPSDLAKPQAGWVYVMNIGFYQLAPVAYPATQPIAESWLGTRPPSGKIGDSWIYFEIPGTRSPEKAGPWLPSVPFQQYRGYAFPVKRPS